MDNLKLFNFMYWFAIILAVINATFISYTAGVAWLAIAAVYLVGECIVKEIRAKK